MLKFAVVNAIIVAISSVTVATMLAVGDLAFPHAKTANMIVSFCLSGVYVAFFINSGGIELIDEMADKIIDIIKGDGNDLDQ